MAFEQPGTLTAVDRRILSAASVSQPRQKACRGCHATHTSQPTTQSIVDLGECDLSATELLQMIVGKSLLDHATRLDNPAAIDTLVGVRVWFWVWVSNSK